MAQRYTCRECGYSFDLTGRGFHTADVKTHCNKIMLVTDMSEQGPRQPLDEKDAEIERLRTMLRSLVRYVRVNVLPDRASDLVLKTIVDQAEYTAEKTWAERERE